MEGFSYWRGGHEASEGIGGAGCEVVPEVAGERTAFMRFGAVQASDGVQEVINTEDGEETVSVVVCEEASNSVTRRNLEEQVRHWVCSACGYRVMVILFFLIFLFVYILAFFLPVTAKTFVGRVLKF